MSILLIIIYCLGWTVFAALSTRVAELDHSNRYAGAVGGIVALFWPLLIPISFVLATAALITPRRK